MGSLRITVWLLFSTMLPPLTSPFGPLGTITAFAVCGEPFWPIIDVIDGATCFTATREGLFSRIWWSVEKGLYSAPPLSPVVRTYLSPFWCPFCPITFSWLQNAFNLQPSENSNGGRTYSRELPRGGDIQKVLRAEVIIFEELEGWNWAQLITTKSRISQVWFRKNDFRLFTAQARKAKRNKTNRSWYFAHFLSLTSAFEKRIIQQKQKSILISFYLIS